MTKLAEIILPFGAYGTYDIFYVAYDNFVYLWVYNFEGI